MARRGDDGELWLLSGSPWWLLSCLLSLQTFAHFSFFFCSRTKKEKTHPDVQTNCRSIVVVDVSCSLFYQLLPPERESEVCFFKRIKPQTQFTTEHINNLTPSPPPFKAVCCHIQHHPEMQYKIRGIIALHGRIWLLHLYDSIKIDA